MKSDFKHLKLLYQDSFIC